LKIKSVNCSLTPVLSPFQGNKVRLELNILAYNQGNLGRLLALPVESQTGR
jgi:hypothetical protein